MIKISNENKIVDKNSSNEKINKILDELNSLNYKIEGEDEILLNLRNEKFKLIESETEKILKLLNKYVYFKLESNFNMNEHPSFPAFFTNNFAKSEKLLLIIPDILMNSYGVFSDVSLLYEGIRRGSMYNLIELGVENKFSVMIVNPNKLRDLKEKSSSQYNPKKSFAKILQSIWNELISPLSFLNKIIIVSHKNSCLSLFNLMNSYKEDFRNKVSKIILIDASPFKMYKTLLDPLNLENKCTNYIPSTLPIGSMVYSAAESEEGVESRSCGTLDPTITHLHLTTEIAKFFS